MEKVKIWGEQIPYNSEKSKLTDMDIKKAHSKTLLMLRFVFGLKGETYKDKKTLYDTFTYYQQIAGGFEKDTYEDEPYIVPFPVPGSKQTVLVVPGGGFAYKQTDCDGEGNQSEGDLMAKELNKQNISAFVLWYRTNPYRFPVPLVDMQRAVRYIRFHASDYGIRPDTISAVGFSAGGFEVAGLINLIRGKNLFPMDYNPDEIDRVSDEIASAGLVYPCLGFHYLMPLLSACFSPEEIDTEKKRQEIAHKYSCTDNFNSSDIPQFLCYGGKDALIVKEHTMEYISKLDETGTRHEVLLLPKANHGFGASLKSRRKYGDWIPGYIEWLNHEVTV